MKVIPSEINEKLEPWAQRTLDKLPEGRRRDAQRFMQHLADEGSSEATLNNHVAAIRTLNGGGEYANLAESDIRAWARELDERYKPGTVELYRRDIKLFLKWIHGNGSYPDCVSWLKPPRMKKKLPRDILTLAEVKQLIDSADRQRARALLFVLYESGARASEMTNARIGDLSFDSKGATMRLDGKTGERRIRLFESVPELQRWLSMHPDRDDPEAFLWTNQLHKGKPIKRLALRSLVVQYAKRAGISKRITPHSLRHSRATHLANVLKEAAMREFFGWSKDSDMPSIYVHLSGRDVDQALFEHYGIKDREEPEDSPLKKRVCDRCKAENSVSARYCWRCWSDFDTSKSDEITGQVMEELIKRAPELLREILKEKGLDRKIAELSQDRGK